MVATPLPFMNCPVRRGGGPYGNSGALDYRGAFSGTIVPPRLARSDYAASAGSQTANEVAGGPQSLAEGDTVYPWAPTWAFNGVVYLRSETRPADVTKGLANVYLFGEKYLNPANYDTGLDSGDNENLYTGFNNDINRVTFDPPQRDRRNLSNARAFGSPHPGGFNMAMCDGSVRVIDYSIAPSLFREAGDRR
jgi:prepilin-type processing-associated H-X9-DG protein